jgi:DNA-binding response OmpR family regulator
MSDVMKEVRELREANRLLQDEIGYLKAEKKELEDEMRGNSVRVLCHRIGLSDHESAFFAVLFGNAGMVVSRSQMYERMYPIEQEVDPKILDVYLLKVRRKLAQYDIVIQTVWKRGWLLSPEHRRRLEPYLGLGKDGENCHGQTDTGDSACTVGDNRARENA